MEAQDKRKEKGAPPCYQQKMLLRSEPIEKNLTSQL